MHFTFGKSLIHNLTVQTALYDRDAVRPILLPIFSLPAATLLSGPSNRDQRPRSDTPLSYLLVAISEARRALSTSMRCQRSAENGVRQCLHRTGICECFPSEQTGL